MSASERIVVMPHRSITATDVPHLRRCVDIAADALAAGDEPFGSLLVGPDGTVLFEDRNRVSGGDRTRHPEFAIARWAVEHLTPAERAESVVYTSGEHCAMCSAAHAWAGLGTIVYASGTDQLMQWLTDWGVDPGPVAPLRIGEVAPHIETAGPVDDLADEVRALHARLHGIRL